MKQHINLMLNKLIYKSYMGFPRLLWLVGKDLLCECSEVGEIGDLILRRSWEKE